MWNNIPEGYDQYWNCSTTIKGYSGTAIFTRVKPIWVQFDFGKKHIGEGRSITMEFEKFTLVCAYFPHVGPDLKKLDYRISEWDKDIESYLHLLETDKKKPVILAGDLNVVHQEADTQSEIRDEKTPCYTPVERQSFSQLL